MSGDAKTKYQCEYMRRRRGAAKAESKTARQAAGTPPGGGSGIEALQREVERLTAENAELRKRHGDDLGKWLTQIDDLAREAADQRRKLKAMHAPPETVAELKQQLKAAHARIRSLMAAEQELLEIKLQAGVGPWAAAKADPTISKAQLRTLQRALHPDGEAKVSEARKRQLTEAFQILNAIKFQMRDD